MKMRLLPFTILAFLALCFASCSNSDKQESGANEGSRQIQGKYLYVDKNLCFHTNLNCITFIIDSSNYAVRRIPRDQFQRVTEAFFCSRCVSDEDYESLLNIAQGATQQDTAAYE